MNKKDIEISIKCAVEEMTPDILDQIVNETSSSSIQEKKVPTKPISISTARKKKRRVYMSLATIAAVVMLVIGGTFMTADATETFLSIDVNPSVELEANIDGEIIDVEPKNEDAKRLVENLELKGKSMEAAVVELLDAMVVEKYITNDEANIVLSVFNNDKNKSEEIKLELTSQLNIYFEESGINGNLHWQQLSEEEYNTIKEKADDNAVSFGKMVMIDRLLAISDEFTEAELLSMSIDEIEDHLEAMGIDVDDIFDDIDEDGRDDDDDIEGDDNDKEDDDLDFGDDDDDDSDDDNDSYDDDYDDYDDDDSDDDSDDDDD